MPSQEKLKFYFPWRQYIHIDSECHPVYHSKRNGALFPMIKVSYGKDSNSPPLIATIRICASSGPPNICVQGVGEIFLECYLY
jgi:hypothetical protein